MQALGYISEKIWQQWMLVTILVMAACVRFYALDQSGLSASELSNIAFCGQHEWFAMIEAYASKTGMPPAYPSLLCTVTDWFGASDFFVRSLSALAGIATVYVAYQIGRHFLSPACGLLAAAIMAVDFQLILISREASAYSLFTLCCLSNSYFFCRLMFDRNQTAVPVEMHISAGRFSTSWQFDPGYPCSAYILFGFWLSGALAYYTNPVALIFLAVELLVFLLFVERGSRYEIGRFMWVPLLVLLLPWLPKFYELRTWVWDGNLFGVSAQGILQFTPSMLLSTGNWAIKAKIICALASVSLITVQLFRGKEKLLPYKFFSLMAFWIIASALSLVLIKAVDIRSLMSAYCFLVIFIIYAVAYGIEKLPMGVVKNSLLVLVIFWATYYQIATNATNKIGGNNGFMLAAKIISADQHFMQSKKIISTNSPLFDHYLDARKIVVSNVTVLDSSKTESIKPTIENIDMYYLEYTNSNEKIENVSPVFDDLSRQYKIVCMTRIPQFRITKFSNDNSSTNDAAVDCQSYMEIKEAEL